MSHDSHVHVFQVGAQGILYFGFYVPIFNELILNII